MSIVNTLAAGFMVGAASTVTLHAWPMDRDLHRGNYRVAVEALALDVDFLARFGFELPMFPQGVQDVYYNDLVVLYLINGDCVEFGTRSMDWHPYTLQGILSGLDAISATRTAEIVRRIYGKTDPFLDEGCNLGLEAAKLREDVQALNAELLWSSSAFAWKSPEGRDADLAALVDSLMSKKDGSR